MNKYDRNQAINFVVFLLIALACLKGCLSVDYVGILVGPTTVESLED